MKLADFTKWLLITTAAVSLVLSILHFTVSIFQPHLYFSIGTTLVFVIFSLLIFFLGDIAMKSSNKYLYNNIIVANFMFKLVLAIMVIILYNKVKSTDDNNYLFLFIIIYIFFTIFETFFMMKQSNPKYEKKQ